jgi:tetratricopeptide (TPR) repeat protein
VDAALGLHEEALRVYEALGDKDGIANALWDIAQIEMQREQWQQAFAHLATSYSINLQLGRLDGICIVGWDLGRLLASAGHKEEAREILLRSRDGFIKLGQTDMAQMVQQVLDELGSA